ncbi:HAD-IA family hydrolase [Phormidium tenue FACHB-886]|nr:HAD-IA family hydrolase [Phormidium tenue FACHB-886]
MITALLFDLDGTLAETDTLHYEIWRVVLQEQGLNIDQDFYKARISGRLNPDIAQDLLPHLSPEEQAAFVDHKEATFREQAELHPLSGLIAFLDWAAQQFACAVVSNAPRENAEFMIRSLKVEDYFPIVILGSDLPIGKPDPLPYLEALKRLGISAAEAIAFEDSPSGIQSAVGAGITVVGIASTHDPAGLAAEGAAIVVKDFADPKLMEWLEGKLGQSAVASA